MSNPTKKKSIFKTPYLFLVPAIFFYLFFWFIPVLMSFIDSITAIGGGISLINFRNMFADPLFLQAFRNTAIFAFISLILQFVVALLLALLINRNFRGAKIFLFIMLIPMAIPPSAVGILWNTGLVQSGWINSILESTGIHHLLQTMGIVDGTIIWKQATNLQAVFLIILVDSWSVLPSVMIIILAGLQNFNKEFSEAALVFGANKFQSVKDIVIPIIKPTLISALILRLIAGLQVWLISVMIFGFRNVPFLLERVVFFTDRLRDDPSAYKIAVSYSMFVVAFVGIVALLFVKLTSRKDWRAASE